LTLAISYEVSSFFLLEILHTSQQDIFTMSSDVLDENHSMILPKQGGIAGGTTVTGPSDLAGSKKCNRPGLQPVSSSADADNLPLAQLSRHDVATWHKHSDNLSI
jgi:hypothetical protein